MLVESGMIKTENENGPGAHVVVVLLTTRDAAEDVVRARACICVFWMV